MRALATCLVAAALASQVSAQCTSFNPVFPGLSGGGINALVSWDPDGPGPLPPQLVAGGTFTYDGQASQDYIAYWDGSEWAALGWGTDGPVNAITTWDPDGSGSLPPQLFIAGDFLHTGADSTGEVASTRIARWDGAAWRALGSGIDGPVYALTTWDPDGPGPLAPLLIAAGDFHNAGGVPADYIAAWNGTSWSALAWGFDGPVRSLTTWDLDGPGPIQPQLIAGGEFANAGADSTGQVLVNHIARWDGVAWRALGLGQSDNVLTMTTLDLDGTGPQIPHLVAGGPFGIQHWDGTSWHSLGSNPLMVDYLFFQHPFPPGGPPGCNCLLQTSSAPATALSLVTFDQTGADPADAQLYTATQMSFFDPLCVDCERGQWGSNTTRTKQVALAWNGSAYVNVNTACCLAITTFATFDPDGPGPQPAMIIGASKLDSLLYACIAATPCGSADFNHDGDYATDADIEAFFACLAGNCCPTCDSADFNNDGDYGTDADIESFFRVLAGGAC
jgi:hypothetical protein